MTLSENPLGCSPRVIKKVTNIGMKTISNYPDTTDLMNTISREYFIKPQNILLGCGSEQLIKLITQFAIRKNDTCFIQRGSFSLFLKEAKLSGARIKFFNPTQKNDFSQAKIVFICNPNNPTGEIILSTFINGCVDKFNNTIFVIDEANGEFMKESSVKKAVRSNNCFVLRTFSKAYGLAGLRLGFAIGSTGLITKLSCFQQPFPISGVTCLLAKTALKDKLFLMRSISFIRKERECLVLQLNKRGFKTSDSITNNIFVKSPISDKLIDVLEKLGVGVISGKEFPGMGKQGFRITIKDRQTNLLFLNKLDQALACIENKKLLISDNNYD